MRFLFSCRWVFSKRMKYSLLPRFRLCHASKVLYLLRSCGLRALMKRNRQTVLISIIGEMYNPNYETHSFGRWGDTFSSRRTFGNRFTSLHQLLEVSVNRASFYSTLITCTYRGDRRIGISYSRNSGRHLCKQNVDFHDNVQSRQ